MCGGDVAPEHVHRHRIADLETEALGDFLFERDHRRALVIGAPPLAFHQARTLRNLAGIGDAAVALQHPGDIRRRLQVFRLDAVGGDDASAQHRHAFEPRVRRARLHERVEAFALLCWNVDEVKCRRLVRQGRLELPAQIAVDLDHGDQQRDAEAERENDGRRQRAGPVDIGDRKPQGGRARMRQLFAATHDQRGDQPQREGMSPPPPRRKSRRSGGHRRAERRARPARSRHAIAARTYCRRGHRAVRIDLRRGTTPTPECRARGRAARPQKRARSSVHRATRARADRDAKRARSAAA